MAQIRWVRCVVAGVGAFAGSILLIAIIVFGYAFGLAFQVRGAPDQARIQAFAQWLAHSWGPIARIVLTVIAGLWASRGLRSPALQGAVVGAICGLAGLLRAWPPDPQAVALFGGVWVAGMVGGLLGARKSPPSP
jgi:hypothetical protein